MPEPVAYKPYIDALKKAHPNWTFNFYDAGMTIDQMVDAQYGAPRSLSDVEIYQDKSDKKIYEGSNWKKSSKEGLHSMIDPLNGEASTHVIVSDNWIYYINFNDHYAYKMGLDGSGKSRMVDDSVSSINVSGMQLI